ncbi:MAG: toll/interleukin-1 receptor domain-containing protein, partial [Acidimicrobiales bacterium]
MRTIFLSYRRGDTAGHAGRLADRLRGAFPDGQVFMDVDTIQPGVDFVKVIDENIAASDVVLALIGDDWLSMTDGHGKRRVDNPDDFVRLELAAALKRKVPLIPVLVEGATMPSAAQLPPELSQLARINALEVSDHRWDYDVGRLMSSLESLGLSRPPSPPSAADTRDGPAGSGKPAGTRRRSTVAAAAAIVVCAVVFAVVVSVLRGDNGDAPAPLATPTTPLLVDVRTNIDDFDYSGTAHVPEFLTTRPINEVGPPPNVRLERGADGNQKGRWAWARQLGAVDATETLIRVTIQGRDDAPVILQGVEAVVVDRKPPPAGANLSYTGLGSAVTPDTLFIDLDGNPPAVTYVDETLQEQRSFTFSVSRTDVQVLNILAGTGECDCSWVVKLKYTFAGRPGELTLDDGGKPFRTVA